MIPLAATNTRYPVLGLDDLCEQKIVKLGRGKVISKKDIASNPGPYPIYSSAKDNDGKFGEYGDYLFDEEMITWSVDGGGHLFYRPRHKFSVTNVGGTLRVLSRDRIDTKFLFYMLSYLQGLVPFDWVLKAHPSVLRKIYDRIPIPPLAEQRRIVAILDEAFAGIATVTANAEKNLANARDLLELEIEQAIWPQDTDWVEATLGEVCERFEYGTSQKSQTEGRVPVLRMGNLQGGEIDWSDLVYTDDEADAARLRLGDGDVLFNRTNSLEHVGKAAIVRGETEAIFAGYLIRFHFNAEVLSPHFLVSYLNCRRMRHYGRMVAGKSVNQANISAGKLKDYPIALPPIAEQRKVAKTIDLLTQRVRNLQATYDGRLRSLEMLKQSLLRRAFSGEPIGAQLLAA